MLTIYMHNPLLQVHICFRAKSDNSLNSNRNSRRCFHKWIYLLPQQCQSNKQLIWWPTTSNVSTKTGNVEILSTHNTTAMRLVSTVISYHKSMVRTIRIQSEQEAFGNSQHHNSVFRAGAEWSPLRSKMNEKNPNCSLQESKFAYFGICPLQHNETE